LPGIKPAATKKEPSQNNVLKKGAKDDNDADDPIAQAIKLREKAGGPAEVFSAAIAKKLGLPPPLVAIKTPSITKPAVGADKKLGDAAKKVPGIKDIKDADPAGKQPPSTKPSTKT